MQQKLFDDNRQLVLPGELMDYTPDFLKESEADELLTLLLQNTPWQQTKVKMYDKEVLTPRLTAWYGDRPLRADDQREPIPWIPELRVIRQRIEAFTDMEFQGVLLNLYRDGSDSVAWHADKDTIPGRKTEIASLSLGAERNFDFRRKHDHASRYSINLQHGSLLLMKGDLQLYWEHRIAKSNTVMGPRINLTFRKVVS
ncbi:alpha-ketoglutarate-dependent dioxygenase AlkB [Olivibacter sp. XZL3]|uniref:alpha-ketoglutarate-dependent dioxygenase AlkB family protein n=1 Tax=Olivibacter sp. XZL3 TaxID=1735116 RepID=UPI001065691A|nr:alpha-ketoglutarate-dependent dioxygenase AlkB [Olivibacter sp. XZL3]